jgi:hypothetical protein
MRFPISTPVATPILLQTPAPKRAEMTVVNGATGKDLRTEPDSAPGNNLDELPDC